MLQEKVPHFRKISFQKNSSRAGIHLFNINHGNRRTMCETISKLTIKALKRRH